MSFKDGGLGLICTRRVYLVLDKVVFIEGCPHVRGGLYKGFHCTVCSLHVWFAESEDYYSMC